MNAEDARKLARRFIELPLEKRRIFLQGLAREGVDFAQFPIPAQVPVAGQGGLSYAQQRMWLLWQLEPGSAAYNLPSAVRLQGNLDVEALEQAFASLVQRHETLRSVFVQQADERLALIPAAQWPQVEHLDLGALDAAEREQRVRALAEHQSLQPFDLARGPLLRVLLLKLKADEHVLLMTLHHIVSDGWSMNVLIEEFSQLYAAHLGKQVPALAALPIQYSDYALWQRCWLEAGEKQRQLDYWRAQLGEEHPPLELALDHSRPALPSYRGARQRLSLDPQLAEALGAFARSQGVTLFMLLLGAFNILLYRYTGQGDLRVGVPIANRNRSEIEGLIGCFVNTQVLRTRLDGQTTVSQLLAAVKDTVLGAQSHQDLPFEQLLEAFALERSLSHTPLFQVMYNHQPQVADVTTLHLAGGLQMSQVDWQSRTTQFDLSLDTFEQGGRLQAVITYASDLFEAPTIERMGRHWQNLLGSMLAAPHAPVEQLRMLDVQELQRIVVDWNATSVDYPLQQPLHRLIEAQVERSPHATALLFADQTLSYAELNARANQLAHCLIEAGIGADSLVGIAVERSLQMVVGLLAILKAGAAYVPFDPDYPAERLAYMIEDSGVRLVLTQAALTERLPLQAVQVMVLDQAGAWLGGYATSNPNIVVDPLQLAYVIYTSGSTGRPKGAGNSHAALVNRLCWMQQAYGLEAGDTVLQKTPFSFDVSVWEFFWPLLSGARLAVAAPGEHREPARLIATIERYQVTTLHFVPSMLQAFIHEPGVEGCRSLKRIVCSGEALPVDAQQQVFARLPQAGLYNLYGPTEAAIDVTHWSCVDEGRDSVPIGVPIANLRTLVLDASLAPVPPGVAGELYLGGQGLARGYHRRPGLTAERFVVDPFGSGERLYRTGDRVRQRVDGVIEYLGRFDHQVKIRGLRIELGEIEARLVQHALVREAVVLAPEGKQLVAYLVFEGEAPDDWQARLKAWLLQSLPEFMLPNHLMVLPALPLTPNGKLDRKALPAPQAAPKGAYQAPGSERERALAQIWQTLLGHERIGLDDNFFELGGDSIIAIQVVSRARQAGLLLAPRDLFQYQTLRSLAQAAQAGTVREIEQGPVHGDVALTPVQQGFFELSLTQPAHWNQSLLLNARQTLEPALLEAALKALVDHHDALRLRFEPLGASWRQFHQAPPAALELWQRQADTPTQLLELCEAAQRSLDLQQGPLLRALLVHMDDGSQRLLLVVHHLLVDGVSWRILLEDLQSAYTRLQAGQAVQLPAKTSAYQAWSVQLQDYLERAGEQLPYWQAQLEHAVDLPCDNRQGTLYNRDAASIEIRLDVQHTRQLLQDAVGAYRTQVNDLLLTALARAVCRWTGHDSALLQLEGHGREDLFEHLDLTRTVGWFTSIFPLRLVPEDDLGASIKSIKEQLRAVPDRGLGFGVLRYLGSAQQRASLGGDALAPRITFNYLGRFDSQFDERALLYPASEPGGAGQASDAPLANWLSIEGQVYAGQLGLRLTFSQAMFQASTVQALADAYLDELQGLIGHCCQLPGAQATPSDFPLARLGQAQLDQLAPLLGQVDELYPLSPMQQGMLFHALYSNNGAEYVNQLRVDVDGLEPERFRQAWEATVQAHDILRSGFIWDGGLAQPLQFVCKQVRLDLREHDWRGDAGLASRLQALALSRRQHGFDLQVAGLLNFDLVRTGEQRHHLIYTHHHILMDGWSNARLLGEVLARYNDQPGALPASRYRDYIEHLQGLDGRAAQQFWTAQLQALDEPLHLARYLPEAGRAQAQGLRASLVQRFDAQHTAQLSAFARQQKITLNTLVQAAWLLLLQHYSGRRSVVVGTTVAGRSLPLPGIEQQIGLFINTLPIIASPRPEQTLAQWLEQVQALNLAVREHEQTPLFEIQRWAGHQAHALFDHILVFENYPLAEALQQQQGPRFGAVANQEQTHYALSVAVTVGDELQLDYDYACDAIGEQALQGLAEHLRTVLEQLPHALSTPLGELQMLAQAEREAVLQRAQPEPPVDVPPLAIHDWVRQQAARTPQACAVEYAGQRLSYEQLNSAANQLAVRLREAGVGAEVVVAIAVERSLEMIIGLLAILKAGGAYLPLDPGYPQARIRFMLDDSAARLLLVQPGLALDVPAGVTRLVLDSAAYAGPPIADVSTCLHPDNLAYMIYTSGSTGTPKGVQVRHGALANHMHWMQRTLQLEPADRVLQKTALSFDASVWECWLPLICGAQLVIAEPGLSADMSRLWARVEALGITIVQAAPSLLQAVLPAATAQSMASLRYLMAGGEALSATLANQLLQRWPGTLVNLYGPTEATIEVTFAMVTGALERVMVPIGRPLDNVRLLVLGPALQLLPAGVVGELCIAGDSLARGYHARPGLTAERFVPDPFAAQPGGRLYRTGDLGCYATDGQIEYAGRVDHQVKVRGFRIETGEIERHLLAHARVRDAVVVARQEHGVQQLVGYLVGADPQLFEDAAQGQQLCSELRQSLALNLPAHMLPTRLSVVAHLPLTPNGKLDRKALLALADSSVASKPYRPASTALQQQVAQVWQEVLKLERVGLDDQFFELGGHSLLATQVISRLRHELQLDLPLRALFDSPSLQAFVEQLPATGSRRVLPDLHGVDASQPQPLSYAQQRLWFLWQLEPQSSMYNIPRALELLGPLQVEAVRLAFEALVARHAVLRTTFFEDQGESWQRVHAHLPVPFESVDLQALDSANRQVVLAQQVQQEALRPFDLQRGPLLRVQLLCTEPERHVLLVTLHHIVADHWSFAILIREFSALYQAFATGVAPGLSAPGLQYLDFAVWQRQWLAAGEHDRQLQYWQQQLGSEHFFTTLPASGSGASADQQQDCEVYEFALEQGLSERLRQFAKAQGLTLYMLLLAGFALVVSQRCGAARVRLGTDVANRNHAGVEEMVGFFVNQLVLQLSVDQQQTIGSFLASCRTTVIGASDHQDLPFDRLVEALRLPRRSGKSPLFAIKFIYQEQGAQPVAIDGLQIRPWAAGQAAAELDLIAEFVNSSTTIGVGFKCIAGLYESNDMACLFAQTALVLEQMIQAPEQPLQALLDASRAVQEQAGKDQALARRTQLLQQHPIRRRSPQRAGSNQVN
ncbi:amino acid adenylation domain-containing protein [Pseudomonas sp. BIGb0427]|uniref:non-ribosomal peptide synthetase n=1 Tax=unclassified Pseudomonas TaxID=196821 RepID=UPI0018A7AE65|nr:MULTISPECIES: non-ribosomal peptide synthetase [unclassified Pseudomonas]QPG62733.1 amino acid adenylation domain-containing protein [Pseudomonas sp. BIGb0427]UVM65137.1 amino acid adenylation domain-containing protein [Pseudomonas sp. B21-009]